MAVTPKLGLRLLPQYDTENAENLNHNLEVLDVFANLVLKSVSLTTEPASPALGDAYWIPDTGVSGANWEGNEAQIAVWLDNSTAENTWEYVVPFNGMSAFVEDANGGEGAPLFYDSATPEWVGVGAAQFANITHPVSPVVSGASPRYPLFRSNVSIQITEAILTNTSAGAPANSVYPQIEFGLNVNSGSTTTLVAANTTTGWDGTSGVVSTVGALATDPSLTTTVPAGNWVSYSFPSAVTGTVTRITLHISYITV